MAYKDTSVSEPRQVGLERGAEGRFVKWRTPRGASCLVTRLRKFGDVGHLQSGKRRRVGVGPSGLGLGPGATGDCQQALPVYPLGCGGVEVVSGHFERQGLLTLDRPSITPCPAGRLSSLLAAELGTRLQLRGGPAEGT